LYVHPIADSCSYTALGSIGGNDTLYNSNFTAKIIEHEMGHNLGLRHSNSLKCSIDIPCYSYEYGDIYDTMGGNSLAKHFNAFQKEILGWLNYNVSPPILNVATSGQYTISPYGTNDLNTKAIKVLMDGSTNKYFYVEYRAGVGFEGGQSGVLIHTGIQNDTRSVLLLDLDLLTTALDYKLDIDQTYTDPTTGTSFKLLSMDANGANVQVVYVPPVPATNPPVVSISKPLEGAIYTNTKGKIDITVSATDNVGIAEIKIFMDGTKLLKTCTNTTTCAVSPSVTSVSIGAHTVSVQVKDKDLPTPNTVTKVVNISRNK
jgi:hypothetical protein